MSLASAIESLARFPKVLTTLTESLDEEICAFAPESTDWSILQIVCHLADEEEFDFPVRIQLTLNGAGQWPPIDPEGWASARNYANQKLGEQLDRFTQLRERSLTELAAQHWEDNAWNRSYQHELLGTLSAGDLLHSWAAHDILHLRQISKRLYQYNETQSADYSTRYAGNW